MEYSIAQIDKTIRHLGRLMPARLNRQSTRKCSLKDAVRLMALKLLEMKELGFSPKELVKALADENIIITVSTLNRYLLDHSSVQGDESVTKAKPAARKSRKRLVSGKSEAKAEQADQLEDDIPQGGLPIAEDESAHDPDKLSTQSDQEAEDD
jgi:DNA-binding transcriptional MerR regulator